MGVDQEHYVIVGIKTDYDALEKQFGEEDTEELAKKLGAVDQWNAEVEDFAYISDGMNGQYAVLGKIVYKGEGYEGMEMTDCLEVLKEHKREVNKKLKELGIAEKAGVFVFTHFH